MTSPHRLLTALSALLAAVLLVSGPAVGLRAAPAGGGPTADINRLVATAGQPLVFTGRVPGGARPLVVQRRWAGKWVDQGRGTSDGSGTYRVQAPMMGMPQEYFAVFAPAHSGRPAWRSRTFVIRGVQQEVSLWSSGDGFAVATQPAIAGRPVVLERRQGPGRWTRVASDKTDADGRATLRETPADGGVYRAVAGAFDSISPYPSQPWFDRVPALAERRVSDPASPRRIHPEISSANCAAHKFDWWPVSGFWDFAKGEGLHPWTDYATGSARVSIFTGQVAIDALGAGRGLPSFGDASTTLGGKGFAYGRWEMKLHAPQSRDGYTPYTTRVSMVPAGSRDGALPARHLVLGEWRGYSSQTRIAAGDGASVRDRTFGGTPRNRDNWHSLAVEISPKRITFLLDLKVVGSVPTGKLAGTRWTPRLELLGVDGQRMTPTRLGADWIRYFELRDGAEKLPQGAALR